MADLRALKILDTPPEERFDRIVQLAAAVFDVPIAYIAMVDSDRQWFKSKQGLEVEETKREVSFCGHTILQKEPLIISDATQDERFCDNPLVVGEPYIRFYAGFPLAGPKGHNVGTLCLASPNPRALTEHELDIFRKFGALIEQALNAFNLISVQHQLLETRNQLLATQEQLAFELDQAAQYVQSLLPKKMEGLIQTDWRFMSSSQLGGDGFGYHWLDPQHLAIYLFDVSGHGVGAALLSVTILKAFPYLSSSREDPGQTLHALNRAFPMEKNGGKFVTCWYGIYNTASRELKYGSAGHPPPIFIEENGSASELASSDSILGIDPNATFETYCRSISSGSRLFVYSDGVYEVKSPQSQMLGLDGLVNLISKSPTGDLEEIYRQVESFHGQDHFSDDFSLLKVMFH